MDLFKALTGKNPAEFERAAQILVETPDIELFKKLVKQEDFLFDFVKNNVAKRIQNACKKENYRNLLKFSEYYSPSYSNVIAEVLHQYGGNEIFPEIRELYLSGTNEQKAYAAKFFLYMGNEYLTDLLPEIRRNAYSDYEPLSANSIETLAKLNDEVSKNKAIAELSSKDEFEQYNAVKFLVTYGAKDTIPQIVEVMKNSSLSENIASEIPFLIALEDLIKEKHDEGILVLCNIINSIPEILPPSAVLDYNLYEILENLYYDNLTSSSALALRMAKEKFEALTENDEYLFDCDKNTKDEIVSINKFLSNINNNKLTSLLYDELYEESDFVFFAVDFADNVEELETLLDSSNQTLILKVLTLLKEKQELTPERKTLGIKNITNLEIKQIAEVL